MQVQIFASTALLLVGGVIGSAITYNVMQTKFDREIDDRVNKEVNEMREYFEKRNKENQNDSDQNSNTEDNMVREIRKKLYNNNGDKPENIEEEMPMNSITVVAPEDTWERDYPTLCLTYYEEDDVLVDESDKIIANVKDLVGEDFAKHFGDYEPNIVHIRNDNLGVVYEISRDYGSYEDYMRMD